MPSRTTGNSIVDLSIIVCTRNRSSRLLECLDSLLRSMARIPGRAELVVVDNGSTDDTANVLADLAERCDQCLRLVTELTPGLSRSRNKGLAVASGEYIAFTDDDISVGPDWCLECIASLQTGNEVALVAGRVLLARSTLLPIGERTSEVPRVFQSPFECFEPMGANFAFHRSVLDHLVGFDIRLGAGTYFSGAEDTDFFYRALRSGLKIAYNPMMLVYHDHGRETLQDGCKHVEGFGRGGAAFFWKHLWLRDYCALRMMYWMLRDTVPKSLRKGGQSSAQQSMTKAQLRGFAKAFVRAAISMRPLTS